MSRGSYIGTGAIAVGVTTAIAIGVAATVVAALAAAIVAAGILHLLIVARGRFPALTGKDTVRLGTGLRRSRGLRHGQGGHGLGGIEFLLR